jgi:hypothetical protein
MKRFDFSSFVISAIFAAGVVLVYVALTGTVQPTQVAVFAGFSAMLGWMVTVATARRNSRKQHTMAVLTQVRISTEVNNRVRSIYKQFPLGQTITENDLRDASNAQAIADVRYMLNYYEFLAVALKHGDLDRRLLKDCIRGQLCDFYKKAEVIIIESRKSDPRGEIESRRYSELGSLFRKWNQ